MTGDLFEFPPVFSSPSWLDTFSASLCLLPPANAAAALAPLVPVYVFVIGFGITGVAVNAREAPLIAEGLCPPLCNELLKVLPDVERYFEWVDAVMGSVDKAVRALQNTSGHECQQYIVKAK